VVAQAVAAIAIGLLGASGVAKLVDPEPTTGAMAASRLPSSHVVSRLLGLTEIGAAVVAASVGGATVLLAASLYAAFAVFTFGAINKRIPLQSCGCFGRDDTPPTSIHVVFNLVAALALFSLPLLELDPLDWGLPPGQLLIYTAFAAAGVYCSYLLLTLLPGLLTTVRAP
jgi:hypothetical protein